MKSQKITPEIRRAILQWYQESHLSQADIAGKIGIANQSVSQWFSGESKSIRRKNWERLYPHIAKYLPDDVTISGPVSIDNSGIIVRRNKGKIRQVNHAPAGNGLDQLMDQILDNPHLSPEAKIEMIKTLKQEAKRQK